MPIPPISDNVVFYVQDNGTGFDMKYEPMLIGTLSRLRAGFDGTGGGLPVVRRQGGRCRAEGQGTTIYLGRPASKGATLTGQANVTQGAEASPKNVEIRLPALSEYRLLNAVEVVNSGETALDYLYCRGNYINRSLEPPLWVLLDPKMPRTGGLEVPQKLRSDRLMKTATVMISTSLREEQDLVNSSEVGMAVHDSPFPTSIYDFSVTVTPSVA